MYTIQVNKLMGIFELAKSMKSNIMYLRNGSQIFGFDSTMSGYMKCVEVPDEYNIGLSFSCEMNSLAQFIKNIQIFTVNILEDTVSINAQYLYKGDSSLELLNYYVADNIVKTVLSEFVVSSDYGSIKSDPNFIRCNSIKSIDGQIFYIKDRYCISLYSGLLPINKSDDVHLQLCDINDYMFLARFSIIKKKSQVDVYLRCMKLG